MTAIHTAQSMPPAHAPLPYQPSCEALEDGEADTTDGLVEQLTKIASITYKDSGHATRGVHAKSHGLLRGELEVFDNLPLELAQGVFAHAGRWPVVMRLSSTPGDMLDDSVSTPRGMAVKVIGVDGERLDGSGGATTQDFVLVNGPVFLAPGPKKFLGSLKMLASTTDKAPGLKKALSAVLRGTERALEAVGGESGTLKSLGGHPETHLLGDTYYSQVPVMFGPYMAKISVAPVAPALTALTDAPLDVNDKPNGLREAVVDFFAQNEAVWEVRVQLCTNLETMPIEDASVQWPEDQSPFIAVARITAPRQAGWTEALSRYIDDGMSFSPWHGVAAHRPLGAIMRVRKAAYEMSARFRAERNGGPLVEPTSLDNFPAA